LEGFDVSTDIRFETIELKDKNTGRKRDAVAVMREGKRVAVIPEAKRLDRAMSLPLEQVEQVNENLTDTMKRTVGREPTHDEKEFWRAVLDYRYGEQN
jgi:hypothetical protein